MLDTVYDEAVMDKALIRESFNRAAASYDRWALLQRRVGERLMDLLPSDCLKGRTILDLGSGTGYCARRLEKTRAHCINLDLAHAMLLRARGFGRHPHSYLCADAESLPIRDRSLDWVFSNLMLQWCPNPERAFHEAFRALKPGGTLIFSTLGPKSLCELRAAWACVDSASHVQVFSGIAETRDWIARSGLETKFIGQEWMRMKYDNVLHLMHELKGIGAHNLTSKRPRSLTGKGKIERMIAAYPTPHAGPLIRATFEVILGRCERPKRADAD